MLSTWLRGVRKEEEKPKHKDKGSPRASLESARSPGWEYHRVNISEKPAGLNLEPALIRCLCSSGYTADLLFTPPSLLSALFWPPRSQPIYPQVSGQRKSLVGGEQKGGK